jgi:acetylornithine deacetylase/succinyl-diaminopimelate desuccinylase-like protein
MPQCPIPEADWTALGNEAVALLQELVRIDTRNPENIGPDEEPPPPPGTVRQVETPADLVLQAALQKDGIASNIYEAEPGRGNIVARLTGNGSEEPVLLLGHLDVVGITRKNWKPGIDPFGAQIIDGRLYGRGASDMKDLVTIEAMTLKILKRYGIKLKRDLILAGVADEEAGGALGIKFLIAQHWNEIAAEFSFNEGATGVPTLSKDGKVLWVGIEATDKRTLIVDILATGTAAHASSELPDNSIYALARALTRLEQYERPVVLNEVSAQYARAMRALFGQDLTASASAYQRAIFRDAIVPTVLNAGSIANVIPGQALATLDCRLLPTTDANEFFAALHRVLDAKGVTIKARAPVPPSPPPSGVENALIAAYTTVTQRTYGSNVPVVPTQGVGTTDSFYLRQKGVNAYGLRPFADATPEGAHGNNESIPVDAFKRGLRFFVEVILELAGA